MNTKFNSEDARKKALETKANSLRQVATFEEQETHLVIDYFARKINIYTTKATVMNRMERMGYPFVSQVMDEGQVFSRTYEFGTEDIGKFLRMGIFSV
jgi:hypothetical protein